MTTRPAALIILDGWGVAPPTRGNALRMAQTPVFDQLVSTYPTWTLQAAGEAVGLPWGEMGNSEVGHLNIGAGRIIYQDLPRITRAITDGSFSERPAFLKALAHVQKHQSQLHLAGLVSSGGIHSFNEHLYALLDLCSRKGVQRVFVHAFLDGRDTPYNSAKNFIAKLEQQMAQQKVGTLATMAGRFWAMDRDRHWDRTSRAYHAMANGRSDAAAQDPQAALDASYRQNVYDEEFAPTVLTDAQGSPRTTVRPHDAILFFNFRSDRMRQMTKAFVQEALPEFDRGPNIADLLVVTMTEYEAGLPVEVAFPPEYIETPLAKVLSDQGMRQLHIAETEKYAHVTFFLNGGREEAFPNEERVLIPSVAVPSFDQKPEMSGRPLTDRIVEELEHGDAAFIVANFANADMVGHTGNMQAMVKAAEFLDVCLGRIVTAAAGRGGAVFITADHGNAEEALKLQTGVIDKEHSTNPVPFIVVDEHWKGKYVAPGPDLSVLTPAGFLADVAPTILAVLGIPQPAEMTGRSLLPSAHP